MANILTKRREIGYQLIDVALSGGYTIDNIHTTFANRLTYNRTLKVVTINKNHENVQVIIRGLNSTYFSITFTIQDKNLKSPVINYCYPRWEQTLDWRVLKLKQNKVIKFYQEEMRNGNNNNLVKQIKSKFLNRITGNIVEEFYIIFEVLYNGKFHYIKETNYKKTDVVGERWVEYTFLKPRLKNVRSFKLEDIDFSY